MQNEEDSEIAFGFELLRRALGRPAPSSSPWVQRLRTLQSAELDSIRPGDPLARLLDDQECALLAKRDKNPRRATAWASCRKPRLIQSDFDKPTEPTFTPARSVSDLPAGLVSDLVTLAGCDLRKYRGLGAAEVTYRPDGRAQRVSLYPLKLPARCQEVARRLFLLTLVSGDRLVEASQTQILVAAIRPDCPQALEEPAAGVPTPASMGGKASEPELVEKKEPRYPEAEKRQKKEAVVILEAIVEANGCVSHMRLVREAALPFALEAILALAQWRFKPALIDAEPVRNYMTLQVDFSLH